MHAARYANTALMHTPASGYIQPKREQKQERPGAAHLLQVILLDKEEEQVGIDAQQPEHLHHVDALPQRAALRRACVQT